MSEHELMDMELRMSGSEASKHSDGTYALSVDFDIYVSEDCVGHVAITMPNLP